LPTLVTHAVVAGAAGLSFAPKGLPARFWVLSAFCSMIPDADVVGFACGIPYGHPFGHRGFFHSPFFGLLLGTVVVFLFFREVRFLSRRWILLALYFSCLTASHGILDAFTNGGLGIALLAPFDHGRYFFPWTPIVVSPIGIRAMFSRWGLRVMVSEATWIWLPSLMLVIVSRLVRSRVAGPKPSALDFR
jgi:inner membrane protein